MVQKMCQKQGVTNTSNQMTMEEETTELPVIEEALSEGGEVTEPEAQ